MHHLRPTTVSVPSHRHEMGFHTICHGRKWELLVKLATLHLVHCFFHERLRQFQNSYGADRFVWDKNRSYKRKNLFLYTYALHIMHACALLKYFCCIYFPKLIYFTSWSIVKHPPEDLPGLAHGHLLSSGESSDWDTSRNNNVARVCFSSCEQATLELLYNKPFSCSALSSI